MVNFEGLKRELQKLNGQDIVISSVGKINVTMGLEHCVVNEVVDKGINICNINNLLDENNCVSIFVDKNNINDYEVIEADYNKEFKIDLINGECMIIMGCCC